jgi:hypothetical protein
MNLGDALINHNNISMVESTSSLLKRVGAQILNCQNPSGQKTTGQPPKTNQVHFAPAWHSEDKKLSYPHLEFSFSFSFSFFTEHDSRTKEL